MLAWLNSNGAAIQAIAGVANVLVAALLAWLTARYVRLTSETTQASQAQADHWERMFEAGRKREALNLAASAIQIREPLAQITLNGAIHEQLRRYSYLYAGDIKQLILSAVDVGSEALEIATKASESLYVINDAIQKAGNPDESVVWNPTERERLRLVTALESSTKLLKDLEAHCKKVADSVLL